MMETSKNRSGNHSLIRWNSVADKFDSLEIFIRIGNSWSQTGMWPAAIVVRNPLLENAP